MLVRFKTLQDRMQSSLFFTPMIYVLAAVILGELLPTLDQRVDSIPDRLTATVDSARSVLAVIAGATLSFAGIAFSVSLLLISLASSQYSPRVVHGLFRDPFNKRVMGIVIGTFTYCLVVMRVVRGPLTQNGDPFVPSISIGLAVVLGIVSILSIVAFISHSAHLMDVSKILHRVTDEALTQIRRNRTEAGDHGDQPEWQPPEGTGFHVPFDRQGWVQHIDYPALLAVLEPGSCMQVETVAGRYAIPETPLCTIWPPPADEDGTRRSVRSAVIVGETRTMQQDLTYGMRQLADVALKALSPGVNDPTTAQDALFHLGAVVREILVIPPASRRMTGDENRELLMPEAFSHNDLVGLAFDEVRIASAGQPTVQIYLLEILHLLMVSLAETGRSDATASLRRQADLILVINDLADLPDSDHDRVRLAHQSRFGD